MPNPNPFKQKGTAIFMALLVVAIATSLSIVWFVNAKLNVKRTQQMLTTEQLYLSADGVLFWALEALKTNNPLPMNFPITPIANGQGSISGSIDNYNPTGAAQQSGNNFLVKADVHIGSQNLVLYSLVRKVVTDSQIDLRVVWQSRSDN